MGTEATAIGVRDASASRALVCFFLFSYSTNNYLQIDNAYGTRKGITRDDETATTAAPGMTNE